MNRRDAMKMAALTAGAPGLSAAPAGGFQTEVKRLNLRHTWTTTMSSSEYRDVLYTRFSSGGITGHGEGAPIVRYKESAVEGQKVLEAIRDRISGLDPKRFAKELSAIFGQIEGQYAAKAALDIAVMDWVGQKLGVPIYQYLGLDPKDAPVTTFSIGMDKPEVIKQKVAEAEAFPVLKVKVGLNTDEEMIASVRNATWKPLRVDANEGWTDREEAVRKINWLEKQGVEFIEQPMAADRLEDARYIRSKIHMPLFADEACRHASDIPKLATAYDGVNIKLDKSGGILEAVRMIEVARACGLKVMLGCMISSSVSCTAAAMISPLVDYADVDGFLLIGNDPFSGVKVDKGRLVLPTGPGLGLKPV